MVAEGVDDALELAREVLLAGRRVVVAARHVLPDEHPEAIGVVVPARRLHLHVLADQVVAEPPGRLDVEGERFVGWRGIEAVGPPALVEQAELEERLAVEEEPVHAGRVLRHRDRAHAEVAVDLVAALDRDAKAIEERIGGGPPARVGNRERERLARAALDRGDPAIAVERRDAHRVGRASAGDADGHRDRLKIGRGRDRQVRHVGARDRLEPDRLPDAGDGGVPDAARARDLLAARLRAPVGGVPDRDDQLLFAAVLEGLGDVEGERIVASAVLADLRAVDEHLGLPVHGAEVEEQPASRREGGSRERTAVPNPLVLAHRTPDAAERRLDGKGNEDAAVEAVGSRRLARHDRVVPAAIEVEPERARPHELRPRVLGQRAVGRDLARPARDERRIGCCRGSCDDDDGRAHDQRQRETGEARAAAWARGKRVHRVTSCRRRV